ncbi:MAG: hypothetical protein RJA70_4414 [Pseudomonadota bacterium]
MVPADPAPPVQPHDELRAVNSAPDVLRPLCERTRYANSSCQRGNNIPPDRIVAYHWVTGTRIGQTGTWGLAGFVENIKAKYPTGNSRCGKRVPSPWTQTVPPLRRSPR